MRLIRPCKCAGSLSYVHLDCLNRWRATSINAQYTCSVCKYQYRFERTLLASFLTSDTGILAITVLILLTAIFLVGYLIDYFGRRNQLQQHPHHPVTMFYRLSNLRPWWRTCGDLLFNRAAGMPTYLTHLRRDTFIVLKDKSIREKIKFVYDYSGDIELQLALFCYPGVLPFTRILENGVIVTGLLGFLVFFLYEAMHRRFREYGVFFGYCFLTAGQPQMGRLAIGLGSLITGYHLYRFMWLYGQKIGQYLGERILEPNH
jgi:hypothetical protein